MRYWAAGVGLRSVVKSARTSVDRPKRPAAPEPTWSAMRVLSSHCSGTAPFFIITLLVHLSENLVSDAKQQPMCSMIFISQCEQIGLNFRFGKTNEVVMH